MGGISHCLGCALLEGAAATHKALGKEGDCKDRTHSRVLKASPGLTAAPCKQALQPAHCTKEQGLCRSVTGLTAFAEKF